MTAGPNSREVAARRARPATGKRLVWFGALVLVPTGLFFALFAWDHGHDIVDGHETSGPYGSWQVAGMAAALIGLMVQATRHGVPVLAAITMPIVLSFWFAQDWSQTDDSGLWAIGVCTLAAGSFLGAGFIALLTRSFYADDQPSQNEPE